MNEQVTKTIKNLERNNFLVYYAENVAQAKEIFEREILPSIKYSSASYADSITMRKCGVLEILREDNTIEFIETFLAPGSSWEELINKRKAALAVELFLTGTNAITESGHLVNLDMIGNRTGAISFGPENVVLFVGVNKIVKDLDSAMKRIKSISAPENAIRHKQFNLPCQKTGVCMDCQSSQRICNTWSIVEKSFPKHRIKIVLINDELGY